MRGTMMTMVMGIVASSLIACYVPGPDGSEDYAMWGGEDAAPQLAGVVDDGVDPVLNEEYEWIGGHDDAYAMAGETELTPGTSVERDIPQGDADRFVFYTDYDSHYDVILDTVDGDADLYTHGWYEINDDNYTCRPQMSGTEMEMCNTEAPSTGAYYVLVKGGLESSYKVLVAESPTDCRAGDKGAVDYCTVACPCGLGDGDCNADNECADGLTCFEDVGDEWGLDADVNICAF